MLHFKAMQTFIVILRNIIIHLGMKTLGGCKFEPTPVLLLSDVNFLGLVIAQNILNL